MKKNIYPLWFICLCFSFWTQAQTVWSGPTITFTKTAFADPTLSSNQDRITNTTWITRGDVEGIFNIAQEPAYVRHTSPANTEWATGLLTDYATLTYLPWRAWANNNPNNTIGINAVLHLKSENIYLGITFLTWGGSTSGGTFSYSRTTAGIPAPVKLAGFTATKKSNAVYLQWSTATEQNTASFAVERSADGKTFTAIGTVPAAGNSADLKQYSFTDLMPLPANFYRLRTNDIGGAVSISNIVAYNMGKIKSLAIFPNPATQVLYVQWNMEDQTKAQILDAAGRIVKQMTFSAGESSIALDIADLKAGMYFLKAGVEHRSFLKR